MRRAGKITCARGLIEYRRRGIKALQLGARATDVSIKQTEAFAAERTLPKQIYEWIPADPLAGFRPTSRRTPGAGVP